MGVPASKITRKIELHPIGTLWGRPTFHVYVRQGRYTKGQLDKTGEFSISVPLEEPDATSRCLARTWAGSRGVSVCGTDPRRRRRPRIHGAGSV